MVVERTVYDRRIFRLLRENAGFFGLGSEIEMLVDGQRARVEVVYGDNSKYGSLLYTVGRDKDDIPLYVFLELGVTIIVSNNLIPTNVFDGVLKTSDDSDPFGNAVVNVRYSQPGIAIGYSSSGSSLTVSAIANGVWTHAFVSKLLTIKNFLGLRK
jgi:hypothetical protein